MKGKKLHQHDFIFTRLLVWGPYLFILPASRDFPDSADTLVESDRVGEVDVDVEILVAIITSPWLPCWAVNGIGVVEIVFPPVRDDDEIDNLPGGFKGARGGPPEATITT